MAIERTVRGRIVPGVDGPVSAPSASFQDFAEVNGWAQGTVVSYSAGNLLRSEASYGNVLGVIYSEDAEAGITRVQVTGLYTHNAASYQNAHFAIVADGTPHGAIQLAFGRDAHRYEGALVGFCVSTTEMVLFGGTLPMFIGDFAKKWMATSQADSFNDAILTTDNLYVTEHAEGFTGPVITLATGDANMTSNNDLLGRIAFAARDDVDADAPAGSWHLQNIHTWPVGAQIEAVATATWDSDPTPEHDTALRFFTRTSGDVAPVERMRLDHDGQLGLGTENPEYAVHVMTGDSGVPGMIGAADGLFLESNVTSLGVTVAAPDAQAALCVLGIDASLTLKGATGNKYATIKMDGAADRLDVRGPNTEIYFGNSAEAKFAMHVRPSGDRDLGSGGARWRYLYVDDVFVNAEITATTVTAATTLTAEGTFTMEKAQYRLPTQVTFNADYEVLATDSDIVLLGAGGAYNVELPTGVAGQDGRVLTVSNLTAAAAKLELDSGAGDIWAMGTNSNKTLAVGERATIQGYWDSGSSRVVWVVTLDTYL